MARSTWHIIAGLSGFSAVVFGALSAHALSTPEAIALGERASTYHLIHSLALLYVLPLQGRFFRAARWTFSLGMLCFCGSLYAKAFGLAEHATTAPFGGTLLMLGWLAIALGGAFSREGQGA